MAEVLNRQSHSLPILPDLFAEQRQPGQMRVGGALALRFSVLGFVVSGLRVFGIFWLSRLRLGGHVLPRDLSLSTSLVTTPPFGVHQESTVPGHFHMVSCLSGDECVFCCHFSQLCIDIMHWTIFGCEKDLSLSPTPVSKWYPTLPPFRKLLFEPYVCSVGCAWFVSSRLRLSLLRNFV